jgi:hypothetical protein
MKTFFIIAAILIIWLLGMSACHMLPSDIPSQGHTYYYSIIGGVAGVGIVLGCITAWARQFQLAAVLLAPFIGWMAIINIVVIQGVLEDGNIVRWLVRACLYGPFLFIICIPAAATCLLSQRCYIWLQDNWD